MVNATVPRSGRGSPFDLWDLRHWIRILNFSGTMGSKEGWEDGGGGTGLVDGLIGLGGTAGADVVGWRDEGVIKDGADAFNKVLGVT